MRPAGSPTRIGTAAATDPGDAMPHRDPHESLALPAEERRAFEAIIGYLAVDDPTFAARMQTRSTDSRWYTWARRRNRRLNPGS